jgi:hypothetical protein
MIIIIDASSRGGSGIICYHPLTFTTTTTTTTTTTATTTTISPFLSSFLYDNKYSIE